MEFVVSGWSKWEIAWCRRKEKEGEKCHGGCDPFLEWETKKIINSRNIWAINVKIFDKLR